MITDNLGLFSDDVAVRADGFSDVLSVMPFLGKGPDVLVTVAVTEAYPDDTELAVTIQESADGASFGSLAEWQLPAGVLAGGTLSFPLPSNLRERFVRLAYSFGSAPSTGRLWAGISRDRLEALEPGQMVRPHPDPED